MDGLDVPRDAPDRTALDGRQAAQPAARPSAWRRLRHRIDPRESLTARLGWAHVAITLATAVLASAWFAGVTRERVEESTGAAFQQYATQLSNEIDAQLYAKLQWLAASAAVFGEMGEAERGRRAAPLLLEFRRQLPEFAWIALADAGGRVVAASGGPEPGRTVAGEAWFREGRTALWADDLAWRDAGRPHGADDPAGFLTMSAPVRDPAGHVVGVLAAQLSVAWSRAVSTDLADSLRTGRAVQAMVINGSGVVLFGPDALIGTTIDGEPGAEVRRAEASLRALRAQGQVRRETAPAGQRVGPWADGGDWIAGWALSDGYARFPGLGWTVWVRESAERAHAVARQQQWRVLVIVLGAGLAIIAAGLLATARLTRHLTDIARSADEIRVGRRTGLAITDGRDEAARIGRSLQALLDTLQRRTRSLESLNQELDARVAARTREVERLADESRQATMMRVRLGLARDLHDTLAQSLMSLLAQIRLMRKLARSDPSSLPDELARAEQAAQDGLREAREAIVRLRHDPVSDSGIGAALAALAERASDRLGLRVDCRVAPALAQRADPRAQVAYRVAEEALRNVQRHAHASRVVVRLDPVAGDDGDDRLRLEIVDDGVGFDTARRVPPGHFGLQGMREQADLVGGTISLHSAIGAGTTVRLDLPG